MKITASENVNVHYIEALCQLFFGAVKFSADAVDALPEVAVSLKREEGRTIAECSFSHLGKTNFETHSVAYDSRFSGGELDKIALGNAFYKAGKSLTSRETPWGILTGIRPSKLVLDYFERGFSEKETVNILKDSYLVSPDNIALAVDIAKTERKYLKHSSDNSVSIYISIPFCPSKCSYCSFVSCASKKLFSLIDPYVERICAEIKKTSALVSALGLKVRSIYIGGGTPSILSAAQTKKLMEAIHSSLYIAADVEFSFEAGRPDTITPEKMKVLYDSGVSRVSVNPQSLSNEVLKAVGRAHSAEDFFRAYEIVAKSGIPIINTDLIAGLPGDTPERFRDSLDGIISLAPQNITVHSFCIKNAAEFKKNASIWLAQAEDAARSVAYSKKALKHAAYSPYYIYRQKNTIGNLENVGWCMDGYESAYNILMMDEIHTIIGIGAGAVTKMVSADRSHIERIFAPKYPYEYLGVSTKTVQYASTDVDAEVTKFYNKYYF